MAFIPQRPFALDVADGEIAGHETITLWSRNPSVGASAESMWNEGGLYPWSAFAGGAITVEIVSDSASDAAAGTGARTVLVQGLDASWVAQSEIITTNGVTAVSSVNSYLRVTSLVVLTAGSTGANVGTVRCRTVGGATVLANMQPTANTTALGIWTVPDGCKAFVKSIVIATDSAKPMQISGFVRDPAINNLFTENVRFSTLSAGMVYDFEYGDIPMGEHSDVDLRASQSGGGTSAISLGLRLLCVEV